MMKTASAPRRIYVRNDIVHVCFEGRTFGPPSECAIDIDLPVVLAKLPSDGGRARVQVSQKRKGLAPMVEVWRSVSVPRKPRA